MLNATAITVVGNLTDDPELRFTSSGVPMARFTVAVNPRVFDKASGEWRDGEPSFYNCTAWRQLAENVAESLSKGVRVIVTGTIAQQRWETDQGEKRSTFAVTAEAVGPDLTYATATVRKTVRAGNGTVGPDDPWATASPTRPVPRGVPGADRRGPNGTGPTVQDGRPVGGAAPVPFDDEPPF
ncbi:single-stranded DNA-binding protein [Micromonospora sp. DT4]|uniref:single-stranded DNA-binding protein n=1 Tax=Micromonospora sp. DT4 TaxID=3393438 RepID=UPI003CEBFDDE